MTLVFHASVQKDIDEVLAFYSERTLTAADRFWDDLNQRLQEIRDHPTQFGFIGSRRRLRRARLRKFPYQVLYKETGDEVWVACVRHEKRHPSYGMYRL